VDEDLNPQVKVRGSSLDGFRHNVGLPLHGQQTHTNAKTCRKFKNVLINQRS
jgi:ribosomal protein S13